MCYRVGVGGSEAVVGGGGEGVHTGHVEHTRLHHPCVVGLVWAEVKQLWVEGARAYIQDMWNILDFITLVL